MNPAEYLEKVAALLDSKRPANSGLYLLYAENQEVHLAKYWTVDGKVDKIRALNSIDINAGPSPKTWDAIQDRIAALMQRGVL